MSASEGELSSTNEPQDEKRREYYSALVGGWMETRMERDKSLLGLSSGGIGLLVTLFTTVGAISPFTLLFYALATLGFCVTIFCSLTILYRNADYVESIINDDDERTERMEEKLDYLDWGNFVAFVLGVLSTVGVAVSSVILG